MTLGIMQPYIFPYIGYFQLVNAVDTYVIYDDVQYMKRGWINRNNILVNNSAHMFTLSLDGASTTKLINEIYIKDDFISFQKTIQQNYSKAPYFNEVYQLISKICSYEDMNLARFACNSIKLISDYLGIQTEFLYSSDISTVPGLKSSARILAICKKLNTERYINAIGGQELYDKAEFNKEGIQLNFLKTDDITYRQFSDQFVPHLSIIDVMMFNTPAEIKVMLENYKLI